MKYSSENLIFVNTLEILIRIKYQLYFYHCSDTQFVTIENI